MDVRVYGLASDLCGSREQRSHVHIEAQIRETGRDHLIDQV